jgi:LysR family glycine cleavage system transcriptional activator
MTEQLGVFCAPSFLKHKRPLRAPQDLPKHTLLRISTREAHWDYYFTTFGMNNVDLTHNPTFEHFFMIVEAAAAGMGIALLPLFLVQDELRSGRLIQALPHIAKPKEAYYIVISRERESQRKVRLLKKWLLEEARRSL